MTDVTQLIGRIERGDAEAADQLLPMVYDELRRLAAGKLAHERAGQTLQPTALVHEAYLRLVGNGDRVQWDSRGHFFAAAAEAMRRILVEKARHRQREKYGAGHRRVELTEVDAVSAAPAHDLLALHEALEQFETIQPAKAQLVKLRYFAGLSIEEAAQAMGVSRATAARHWTFARAWLFDALK